MVSRLVANCTLFVASIFVALILGEGILRLIGISYPVFDDFDHEHGVRLKPGKQGWYRAEGEAYLSINSLGYRDREHDRAKPEGTFRIAVLGDSFVEARQVSLEDTFWYRLGRQLEHCSFLKSRKVEVLSFGVGGDNTTQAYLRLRDHALDFSPDIVLLAMFLGNDVAENSKGIRERSAWRMPAPTHSLADGELVLDTSFRRSKSRRVLYNIVHHSRLAELANEIRRKMRAATWRSSNPNEIEAGVLYEVYSPPRSSEWRQAWHITSVLLAQMNDLVARHGGQFIVTTIPHADQVDPSDDRRKRLELLLGVDDLFYPDEQIAKIAANAGFTAYPLAGSLHEVARQQGIYMHGFENTRLGLGHMNDKGHAAVAKLLGAKLCSEQHFKLMDNEQELAGTRSAR